MNIGQECYVVLDDNQNPIGKAEIVSKRTTITEDEKCKRESREYHVIIDGWTDTEVSEWQLFAYPKEAVKLAMEDALDRKALAEKELQAAYDAINKVEKFAEKYA